MRLELKHQGTTMQLRLALDDDRVTLTSPVTLDTPWSMVAVRTTLRLELSLSRRAAAMASSGNAVVPSMYRFPEGSSHPLFDDCRRLGLLP